MTIPEIIERLEKEKNNMRFAVLLAICREHFGGDRKKGSHHIFKTPWMGDPRLNLQADKGKAKPYQVEQVIAALSRLSAQETEKPGPQ